MRGRRLAGEAEGPLAGSRILDLTTMWAGPYCTWLVAALGAEVIKIEAPIRPDGTRGPWHPQRGAPVYPKGEPGPKPHNRSAPFNELNRNKYGITLDLSQPQGRELFQKLVAISDAVVENFSPRVMRNFGLDYLALQSIRPDIIMLSLPAYGASGPYQNYVAYGTGLELMSGLASLTGYEGGPPMRMGVAYGDPVAGLHGALALLAALHHRRRTGKGQRIDLSQREALTQFIGEAVTGYTMNRGADINVCPTDRQGNRHPYMAPHGCYRCQGEGRWVAIAVGSDEEFRRLCQAMGTPDLAEDPRYADAPSRRRHQAELDGVIQTWTSRHEHYEVARLLQAAGIAAGPVLDPKELLADPHLAARGFFQQVSHPEAGTHPYPGLPWRASAGTGTGWRPAPRFGEHNEYVYGQLLGLSPQELGRLEEEGVIGTAPKVNA